MTEPILLNDRAGSGRIIRKVDPPASHKCEPPYDPKPETVYGAGTVWQCECGRKAKLVADQREGGYCWQWM